MGQGPDPSRYNFTSAGIAQLVEQLICNQKVVGSIPIAGTRKVNELRQSSGAGVFASGCRVALV